MIKFVDPKAGLSIVQMSPFAAHVFQLTQVEAILSELFPFHFLQYFPKCPVLKYQLGIPEYNPIYVYSEVGPLIYNETYSQKSLFRIAVSLCLICCFSRLLLFLKASFSRHSGEQKNSDLKY